MCRYRFYICRMKAVFTLRSHSFSTPKCCHPLRLDPVARWWSLPTSAPLLSSTSSSDHLHILLIIRWSIWFLSLPLGEYKVLVWKERPSNNKIIGGADFQWPLSIVIHGATSSSPNGPFIVPFVTST